ncbi:MAG: PLP-dependent aminotransferase family protein [Actinomycetota bacterium]|nr:PLP-dependent aminotransferase family protein [Actinomycetota bacterium]
MTGRQEASRPIDLVIAIDRDAPTTLGAQIEAHFRRAVRDGQLRAGTRIPSTRDLARQLSVSRRVTVDAYAQLAAEGYVVLRQGAHPQVADGAIATDQERHAGPELPPEVLPRFDFRPSRPDVSAFPRQAWSRSLRTAVASIADAELVYGNPCGVEPLRTTLAEYLGRVRGVVGAPGNVVVTSGYIQGLGLACRALAVSGARRIALEDPSAPEQGPIAHRAGLEPVPVPVDAFGLRVDALDAAGVDAVVVTPAHQHPTGVVLAPERRTALVDWLRRTDAFAIEDDYDAEYRYDRAAVKAFQGLVPDCVVYAGSTSKTLAPALRMGWLVVPGRLLDAVAEEKALADQGSARIEQHALADFIARGELDRHLRRMRLRYRARRDLLIDALADAIPDAQVQGIAAGLHVTVRLRGAFNEPALREAARARRVELSTLSDYTPGAFSRDPVLLIGYAQVTEAAMAAGVRELAAVVASSRTG